MSVRDYLLFGLRVRSDLDLPELSPCEKNDRRPADITIRLAPIHAGPLPPGMAPFGGGLLLTVESVGRYFVENGREIRIEVASDADPRTVRLFLLGSALGALLHQRGMLPLHANAVVVGSNAFAFMGPSGAGKSTLAAWFHKQGHVVLGDDICVIGETQNRQLAIYHGLKRLRLWDDSISHLGWEAAKFDLSFPGDPERLKYDVPVAAWNPDRVTLGAVVLLGKCDSFSLLPLSGAAAVEAIISNIYRGRFSYLTGSFKALFEQCVNLMRRVPVLEFRRRWAQESINEDAAALFEALVQYDSRLVS